MIDASSEVSIEEFIEINDEMDAKSWFITHLFSGNKVFKHALNHHREIKGALKAWFIFFSGIFEMTRNKPIRAPK